MTNTDSQQLLKTAISAIKAGDKAEGKRLLAQALRVEPENETAWLWMSGVVETRQERIDCLQKVLAINPANAAARRGLEQPVTGLSARLAPPPPAASQPVDLFAEFLSSPSQPPAPASPVRQAASPERRMAPAPAPAAPRQKPAAYPAHKKSAMSPGQVATLALLGLLVVVILIVAAVWVLPMLTPEPANVSLVTEMLPRTSTPLPTSNPLVVLTVTALDSNASPEAQLTADLPANADPRLWVLTQADLSLEYELLTPYTGYLSNEALASKYPDPSETLAMLAQVGRVNGYLATYEYTSYEVRQMTMIAELLADSAGARRYLEMQHNLVVSSGWSELLADTIGDASHAYTRTDIDERNDKLKWVRFLTLVQQRNTLTTLTISAPEGQAQATEALRLAGLSAGRVGFSPPDADLPPAQATAFALLPAITPDLSTPTPTLEPTPSIIEQIKKLGPVTDYFDSTYSLQVTVNGGRYSMGRYYEHPAEGNNYIILDVTVTNLGPGVARYVSPYSFQLKDGNGVIRSAIWLATAENCLLTTVDLAPQGVHSGCLPFEASRTGTLTLIFKPIYLQQNRSTTFTIRE